MQAEHWSGPEGDAYTARQTLSGEARFDMYRRVTELVTLNGLIEFGANDGSNLLEWRRLDASIRLAGVEVNEAAYHQMKHIADVAHCGSMLDDRDFGVWDMSMTRGVLIHISPDSLNKAYEALYNASRRYICITEYYSRTPRMIPYRGKDNLLWARDFAGEMMDLYPLKLVDYFFTYHRDPLYPQDDVTTFIMERK